MIRARSLLFFEQKQEEGKTLQVWIIDEVLPDGKTVRVRSMTPSAPPDTFIRNRAIVQMCEEIEKGAGWLEEFNWALRYTDSPADPFVSTELPFIVLGLQAVAKLEAAIHHPDTLLFFPLCWQACLVGSRQLFDIETGRFGPQDMQKVRHIYRDSAQIFLVSPTRLNELQ